MNARDTAIPSGARGPYLGWLVRLTLVLLLAGALATYHPEDPSLNTASTLPAVNAWGWLGAALADLLAQSLGFAAWLIPAGLLLTLVPGTKGLYPHLGVRLGWLGLLIAAGAAARPEWFSLGPVLHGGVLGTWMVQQAGSWVGPLGSTWLWIAAWLVLLPFLIPAPWRRAWIATLRTQGRNRRVATSRYDKPEKSDPTDLSDKPAIPAPLEELAWDDGPDLPALELVDDPQPAFVRRRVTPPAQPVDDPEEAEIVIPARAFEPPPRPRSVPVAPRPAPPPPPTVEPAPVTPEPAPPEDEDAERAAPVATRLTQTKLEQAPTTDPEATLPLARRELPGLDLLSPAPKRQAESDGVDHAAMAKRLEEVLAEFKVQGEIHAYQPGPVITLFEFEPAAGVKVSRVVGLSEDLGRAIGGLRVRVVGTLPGKTTIGIEVPNPDRETVYLREIMESPAMRGAKAPLTVCLGKDIAGDPVVADLAKMPHLLVAGTTGSGKSVGVNDMLISLLLRLTPEEARLILVDPKMLELSVYADIPHLLTPVVTDPAKAAQALAWAVMEMERRYKMMADLGVRNLDGYNAGVRARLEKMPDLAKIDEDATYDGDGNISYLHNRVIPRIVVVVDELADLMMVAGREVEISIARLAQMARAAGIHVILATQRPSVDVITGMIKANFPSRIAFRVFSKIDSRTILDQGGAEQLLGQGDMLFLGPSGELTRLHAPFVSDAEVTRIVERWREIGGKPDYIEEILAPPSEEGEGGEDGGEIDPLFDEALGFVIEQQKVSTSMIQRRFKIGYNRAARIVEQMEHEGVITPQGSNGQRQVLARKGEY